MPATSPGDKLDDFGFELASAPPSADTSAAASRPNPALRFRRNPAVISTIRIVRIEFAIEHAAELEIAELGFDCARVRSPPRRALQSRLPRPRVPTVRPCRARLVPTRSRLLTMRSSVARSLPRAWARSGSFQTSDCASSSSNSSRRFLRSPKSKIPPERVVACLEIFQLFTHGSQFRHDAPRLKPAPKTARKRITITPRSMYSTMSCSVTRSR